MLKIVSPRTNIQLILFILTFCTFISSAHAQFSATSDRIFTPSDMGIYHAPMANDTHKIEMAPGYYDQASMAVVTGTKHGRIVTADGWQMVYVPDTHYKGVDYYTYYMASRQHPTPSNLAIVIIYVGVYVNGDVVGDAGCMGVGEPVNTSNGNMYLQHTDYVLPGVGYSNNIIRYYNTYNREINLFGLGWTTLYDQKLDIIDPKLIRYIAADGAVTFFGRMNTSEPFKAIQKDTHNQIIQNADGTYSLTLSNGMVHQFNSSGKLTALKDRNNNQTNLIYDNNGRLSTVTDAVGRTLTFTTNGSGRVTSISDTVGTIANYTYGTSQELLSVTYQDNSKYQLSYTTANSMLMLATVKDALGNILETHEYDAQGRATTSERHGGVEKYTLNYISDTETHVTNALGHVTKYFFDKTKDRTVLTKTEGSCACGTSQVTTRTYDNYLNVTSTTNALNQTTSYTYDAQGNVLSITDSLGKREYTYNSFGQILTAKDTMGGITTFTYDAAGNPTSIKDALNNTTSFTYNNRGQLLTKTDARNNVTSFTYNSLGQLIEIKDALNNSTTLEYNSRGRISKATDSLNNPVTYAYDQVGRLKTITFANNSTITYDYDEVGRQTKVTDARGKSTSFAYDGAYRLTSVTDATNKTITYTYNLMSQLTAKTDALGRSTNLEYDDFNRLVKIIYPEASVGAGRLFEKIEYDVLGNVTKRIDTTSRATSYVYDGANRLSSIVDPAGKETKYEYNNRSDVTAVVDAVGQRYSYTYDVLGRVLSQSRNGHTKSFVYDAVGNRTKRTDYNGAITNYTYDVLNRLSNIGYPNSTSVVYEYDKLSRLLAATNQHGTVSFTYNNVGQVQSTTDVWGEVLNYTYDANGNRTELKRGTNSYSTYAYDDLNRLTELADGTGAVVATYSYDEVSRLKTRSLANGVTTTYQYNGLDQLTSLVDVKGSTTIASNQYVYNNAGNIMQNIDEGGIHGYSYDMVDRLIAATYPGLKENYTYDGIGNRSSATVSGDTKYPFLNGVGASTYSYNKNGNPVTKTTSSGVWQYEWDYENRLTKVTLPSGTSVSYKYDALGRRIQRSTSTGNRIDFVYDGEDVILDKAGDGSVVAEYINGPGIDNKIRQKSGATTYYYIQDHLGSTKALTDGSGGVVERISYSAYGESTGSSLTRYTYTGREADEVTGLIYYRARWYDPSMGRFISEDPIEFAGGSNWYAYVGNNPVNFVDPLGLNAADFLEGLVDFTAGNGDTLSTVSTSGILQLAGPAGMAASRVLPDYSFTLSKKVRQWMGTDCLVDSNSTSYKVGVGAAIVQQLAGLVAGVRGISKTPVSLSKTTTKTTVAETTVVESPTKVPITDLEPTHGMTKSNREFLKLFKDIRENGIKEPIKFVVHDGLKYIVDGHHRYFAARKLGMKDVPVEQVHLPYKGYKTPDDLLYFGW
jgi:RHS repeat-associated protein